MKLLWILFLTFMPNWMLLGQNKHPHRIGESLVIVNYTPDSVIKMEGNIHNEYWGKANKEYLRPPWGENTSKRVGYFTSFTDSHYMYFAFEITDSTLNIFTYRDELSVTKGDRVEIFFAKNLDLKKYYCFEINPAGKVLDYKAKFYRKFDYHWKFKRLVVVTHIEDGDYIVEGRIPLAFIKKLCTYNPITKKFEVYGGIFSADYYGTKEKDVIWNSWIKPNSKLPDFHIPSAFGKFIFDKLN